MNCLSQSSQFIITLFQLILVIALRHDTTSSLEPEFAITANKGTNYNSLIQIAVQSYESDTSTIGSNSEIICIALTLGAPLKVPAGKVSMNSLIWSAS